MEGLRDEKESGNAEGAFDEKESGNAEGLIDEKDPMIRKDYATI